MKLLSTFKQATIAGVTMPAALDEKGRLWFCKVSPAGTALLPIFGPITQKTSITSPTRNRTNDPYIVAGRKILREISE